MEMRVTIIRLKVVLVLVSFLMVSCNKEDDGSNEDSLDYQITNVEPRKVYTGDYIAISGNGLDAEGIEFKLDAVILPIIEQSGTQVIVRIPKDANTGIINSSIRGITKAFGDVIVSQEQDNFYAHLQESACEISKITKLKVDTFEPETNILNLPNTCVSVDRVLFCKERNILVYSYTYLLSNGDEARKAIIKNFNDQSARVLVLSDGSDDVNTSTLLSVSRDKLFFVEYRSQNPPGLKNHIIYEYFFEFDKFNITYAQFRADAGVEITSAFDDTQRTLLVYYRDEGAPEGMFKLVFENGSSYTYPIQRKIKDILVNENGQAFALESEENRSWNITNIRADAGTLRSVLSTFTADHAENLFYSESTNRLFVRYTDEGTQNLHKVPLGFGIPTDTEIDGAIQSIYSYD